MSYNLKAIKSFKQLDNTNYQKSTSGIICNTDSVYPLGKDVYVIPFSGI